MIVSIVSLIVRTLDILANFPLKTSETKCEVINMVYMSCITSSQTKKYQENPKTS